MIVYTVPVVVLHGATLIAAHRLAAAGARRHNSVGIPLRTHERELLTELTTASNDTRALAQRQQRQAAPGSPADSPMTAEELAQQRGVSVRTIQRHAADYGGWKHNGRWLFPADLRDRKATT
ncbi:hypothetical protein [Corynebacterium halotolerans]|uniref:hypothetical protein n=1 Tax=Corynebacterium halotolerans TaxID=225326 RepID=UPI003CF46B46